MNRPKVIAVDFDGTLCRNKWPDIGDANTPIIHALLERQKQGDKLILWTCREGDLLNAALMWCIKHDLHFDAVNDNLPERTEYYGNNSRKIGADEYWDDRSVLVGMADGISMILSGPLQLNVPTSTHSNAGLLEWIKRSWRKWRSA